MSKQLNDKVRDIRFALQMDEAIDSNKDCLLITYVRFIDEDDLREELLFCKKVLGRATAEELFKIIDTYLKEANLKWKDCVGIYTDRLWLGNLEGCKRSSSASPPMCSGSIA